MDVRRLSAAALVGVAGLAHGQAINEHFDAVDPVTGVAAPGWFTQNNSSPLGITPYFPGTVGMFAPYASLGYLGVNFNSGAGVATISNWQVTPPLLLQNGQQLLFLTRTVTAAAYPDRLQVRLSQVDSTNVGASPTDVGTFTQLLLDINPFYTLLNYPTSWAQYVVPISGLPGPVTGRLAFRYFVENGGPMGERSDYIGIDEAVYPATLGACCLSDGSCVSTATSVCTALAGVYQGDGVTCVQANCQPQPPGACCLTDGTCTSVVGAACLSMGGTFSGPGSTCAQAACGTTCYTASGLNVLIPDGGVPSNGTGGFDAVATINITDHGTIQSLTAKVLITHSWQGDVRARLVHPDGTGLDLINRPGVNPPKQGSSTTLGFAFASFGTPTSFMRFANSAANGVYDSPTGTPGAFATGTDNVTGVWIPAGGSTAVFAGKDIFGVWSLIVNDYAAGDSGAINGFSVCATVLPPVCYPNCDHGTTPPCLNVQDFSCFLNAFATGDTYANCDLSTTPPTLNVQDFTCFLNSFAGGCSSC